MIPLLENSFSPNKARIASTTELFPEPFSPTNKFNPFEKETSTTSENILKSLIEIFDRYMLFHLPQNSYSIVPGGWHWMTQIEHFLEHLAKWHCRVFFWLFRAKTFLSASRPHHTESTRQFPRFPPDT